MEIMMQCPFCGKTHSVNVEFDAWLDYMDGELVQNAFPNLSPTEREQIISNLCPSCQDSIFGEVGAEEDEEEDYREDDYDFPWDYDDEPSYDLDEGFDPYMGEYTFDC